MKKLFFLLLTVTTHQITIAQNVGIGTTAPTEKLQVAGNIKADTIKPNGIKLTPNAGNGKVLISDAAGVGTWQASSSLAGAGNIGYGVWGDCATNGNISEYQPVADSAYPFPATMPSWGLIWMMLVPIQTRVQQVFINGTVLPGY
jgi:hypothetical protein